MSQTDAPHTSLKAHIANHYIRASIGGALRQGAELKPLLAAAGISEDWIDRSEHTITERQLSELVKAVWRFTRDEFMGLSPHICKRGVFSLAAELSQGASTLGGMLRQSARMYTALSDDLNIGLEVDNRTYAPLVFFRLHLRHNGEDSDHFLQEFIMLMWQRFASWLVGQQVPIASTVFGYSAPAHAREYRSMYLGELLYEHPVSGFYFHPRYLQLPIIRNAVELQSFLQDCPAVILHRPVRDNSLQTRIRILLQRYDLEQMPELEDISHSLAIAPRTLRRKLLDEGTSVRQIKEAIRRDFALKLLTNEHLSVQEIAEQSGFAEAAAFCRAFKRWTGESPSRWRRQSDNVQG